jgi:hypothetical protein
MYERLEVDEAACRATFRWFVEQDLPAVIPPINGMSETRKNYIKWLRFKSGVFPILVKLASGKSTLMKFLVGPKRTDESAITAPRTDTRRHVEIREKRDEQHRGLHRLRDLGPRFWNKVRCCLFLNFASRWSKMERLEAGLSFTTLGEYGASPSKLEAMFEDLIRCTLNRAWKLGSCLLVPKCHMCNPSSTETNAITCLHFDELESMTLLNPPNQQ